MIVTTALSLLLNAAPSIYKLFTSDDKSDAVKDLTKSVVTGAAKEFGIELDNKDQVLAQISKNPDAVIKLKELEYKFSTDIEKLNLESRRLELKDKELEYNFENQKEEHVTKRWLSDNQYGSKFAKLVRPGLTVYLVFVVTLLAIFDGNAGDFTIKDVWVTLFTALCLTTINGYFILRSSEKKSNSAKWK